MHVSHGRSSLAGTHLTGVHLEAAVPKPAVPELCPRPISRPIVFPGDVAVSQLLNAQQTTHAALVALTRNGYPTNSRRCCKSLC
jgi:hypothetical protein